MKLHIVILVLQCSLVLVTSQEEPSTRDLADNTEDYDDIGRKHRKKKKHQSNPCFGGYGRTFGSYEQTYLSAPVTNYFFGCGGPIAPAPLVQYPVQFGGGNGHGGNGHGGHNHGGHNHGGYNHGGHNHGGHGHGGFNGPVNYGFNQPYQFNQYQPFNGPQSVVAAAASGFGNAVAGYLSRPRKVNKQINQFLRPLYNLF